MISADQIKKFFRGNIGIGESMAKLTKLKVGGAADFYFEPFDAGDLSVLIAMLNENEFPYAIIGSSSNVLVDDHGYRGAVINLGRGLNKVESDGEFVRAGAGARLSHLVNFCIDENLRGIEMLTGIHGTLGGTIISNEKAYGGTVSDYLVGVEVIRRGKLIKLSKDSIVFGDGYSSLQDDIVVNAFFKFPAGDKGEMKRIRRELLLRRNETEPDDSLNTGKLFKNPVMNSAARLIENCGLKGLRIRDAQISERHPNFVVNLGSASSCDVIEIIRRVEDEVQAKFDVTMELEIRLLGLSNKIAGQIGYDRARHEELTNKSDIQFTREV